MKRPRNGFELIDSEHRAKESPDTWAHPPQGQLNTIQPGFYVKVGLTHTDLPGERFWGIAKDVAQNRIRLQVDQELVMSRKHGVNNGDFLIVQPRHIFAIRNRHGAHVWDP